MAVLETVFYPRVSPAKEFSGKTSVRTDPIVVDLELGMALCTRTARTVSYTKGRPSARARNGSSEAICG